MTDDHLKEAARATWVDRAHALVAVGGVAYALLRPTSSYSTATTYTTGTAATGTLSVTVAGTGNVEVDGTTDVYPATSGTVASIKVAEGDKISKGDVLFTLDADTAEAATAKACSYRQAQQGVAQASANLVKAEQLAIYRIAPMSRAAPSQAPTTAREGRVTRHRKSDVVECIGDSRITGLRADKDPRRPHSDRAGIRRHLPWTSR